MPGVSMRTLVLMLELLVAVLSFQYLEATRRLEPRAVWVASGSLETSHVQSGGQ